MFIAILSPSGCMAALLPFVNEIYFNIVIGSIPSHYRCDPYSHGKHGTTTIGLMLRDRPV